MTVDVSGVLSALSGGIEARITTALEQALSDTVVAVKSAADAQVPLMTGDVLTSGTAKVDLDALIGGVGYSHPSAPALHENPRGRRYKHGRKAKFLEDPANSEGAKLLDNAAAAVRRVL